MGKQPVIGTLGHDASYLSSAIRLSVEQFDKAEIDCAPRYGNLEEVAKAIRASGVGRQRLRITSKINTSLQECVGVHRALTSDLRILETDYIDCYLIHSPRYPFVGRTWADMKHEIESGRVLEIGVSNFTVDDLRDIDEREVAVSQDHISAYVSDDCPSPSKRHEIYGIMSSIAARGDRSVIDRLSRETGCQIDELLMRLSHRLGVIPILGTMHLERLDRQLRAWKKGPLAEEIGSYVLNTVCNLLELTVA